MRSRRAGLSSPTRAIEDRSPAWARGLRRLGLMTSDRTASAARKRANEPRQKLRGVIDSLFESRLLASG